MTDEAPVVFGLPLCATCGGAGVDGEGHECPDCEGYGMLVVTDDDGSGPKEAEEDVEDEGAEE